MKPVALWLALPLLLLARPAGVDVDPVDDVNPIDIKEWPVPWENTRPRDPYVDHQGRVWFCGQRAHYLAYLNPETGEFKRFDLDDGVGPHNLIVDREGYVWYAGNRAAHIGRLDPKTGEITKYPMPNPAARDPHTLVFDQNGDIWFTLQQSNMVGKFTMGTHDVRVWTFPTERSRPYGIEIDSKGRPWIVQVGTHKIATVDPQTMELREIDLPRADARPRRIAITSDDKIWYVDYAKGFLGRYDPVTGKIDEWESPSAAASRPYAMTVDDRDHLWFVETGPDPNQFVGFDPKTEKFFSVTSVPSGGGTVRHMIFHEPTRTIWFGTDTNNIGRAVVP